MGFGVDIFSTFKEATKKGNFWLRLLSFVRISDEESKKTIFSDNGFPLESKFSYVSLYISTFPADDFLSSDTSK